MWPLLVLVHLVALGAPAPVAQGGGLTGTWTGRLTNLPTRAGAPVIEVTREVGPMPAEGGCTPFKTTYREGGEVRQVKDYRLCREAAGWFVDEGGGVRLTARFLDDVLVSAFKVGNLLLMVRTEVRHDAAGDVMEEDIMTADDRAPTDGIVSLPPRSMQRLRFTRVVRAPGQVQ